MIQSKNALRKKLRKHERKRSAIPENDLNDFDEESIQESVHSKDAKNKEEEEEKEEPMIKKGYKSDSD